MRLFVAALAALTCAPTAAWDSASAPWTASIEALAESVQAMSEGDPARAERAAREGLTARPAGSTAARLELALGLGLREAGRFAEAAEALGHAAGSLAERVLAHHARFEQAQCLFYSGHPGAAAALFADVGSRAEGPLAARARWREADALLASGAPRLAARAYDALLVSDPASPAVPGASLALAAALRASGEPARAISTYRRLWIEHPADPAGQAAGQALRAWRMEWPAAIPVATPDERLARAARLLELAQPRRALRTLDRLDASSPPPEPATRSALLRALALLQLGRHLDAAACARPLESSPVASPGTRVGAVLVLARVAARAGRPEEAAARYRAIAASGARIVPGLPAAQARSLPDDAGFLAAWAYYDAGAFARAAELLHDFARAHPGSRRASDAQWFEAWSLHRLGARDRAVQALARLTRVPQLREAALYWQARLAPERERQAALRRLAREVPPDSWYGLLAAGRLAGVGEAPAALPARSSPPIPDGPVTSPAGEPLTRAAGLLGAGLTAEGLAELRALAGSRHAAGFAPLIAQLAEAAGDAELPFRVARDQLPSSRRAQRWLYPLAYPEMVPISCSRAGVDPSLCLAVMRRESAFRPDARSGAGAVGLVQLIPPTAERLATVHGVSPSELRSLDLPEVSVPAGAAYLGLLTDRFVDTAVVLAAYNAGPTPAAAWARDRAGLPLDEWVEDIPFRETRRYVKSVMADFVVYRALWEGGPLAIDGARTIRPPRQGVAF